jgi:cyclohexanecarboxylate-CoA ligase
VPLTATFHSTVRFPELDAQPGSTPELLDAAVRADPSRVLLIDAEKVLTTGGLIEEIALFQARLRAAGVRRGDVVAAQLPNWWETVALAHAVWGMGAVLNPITPIYRERELTGILGAARPAAVVVPAGYRGGDHVATAGRALRAAGVDVPLLVLRDPGAPAFAGGPAPRAELAAHTDDICVLMFTSGTTGTAKGVLHSHRTLLVEAASIAGLYRLEGDRVFMPSPLTHITGLVYGMLMPLLMDGDAVLLDVWDPAHAVQVVERHGCTVCVGATPFLSGLVEEYRRLGEKSSLKAFVCGGADVPPALVRRGQEVLGSVVARAYGLTEMPTVTCGGPTDTESVRADTDGPPVGSAEVRIRGGGDQPADVGELQVRGPELCLGYLDEDHTRAAFDAEGWFSTGDLARIDETGAVTILGRIKDLIVRAGENLSALEIEGLLLEHPQVAEVAVVGVPDDTVGERACAIVVARGAPPTLVALTRHLGGYGIARQKFPEHLLVSDSLPRTPSGKIQKFLLRAEADARLSRGEGESR